MKIGSFRFIKGFTVVEVLIALVIVSVGIAATAKFNLFVMHNSTLVKERTEAVNLAHKKLENFRNVDSIAGSTDTYDVISDGSDTVGSVGSGADVEIAGLLKTYTRTWTVVEDPSIKLKTIDIITTWDDGSGQASADTAITASTIVSGNDPAVEGILVTDSEIRNVDYAVTPGPEPAPEPAPGSEPAPAPGSEPAPAPAPAPGSEPAPEPTPAPESSPVPAYEECSCQRKGKSGSAAAESPSASCTDGCCSDQMPADTPKNGFFLAMCPV